VLTDIKMPGVDGLAVLQHIKEVAPQTAVIVITGHGDTALAEQAVALDAVDFINKPIKKEALDAALKKAREKLDSVRRNGGSQKG
jgi:YesN/AraC family two-component response regulator